MPSRSDPARDAPTCQRVIFVQARGSGARTGSRTWMGLGGLPAPAVVVLAGDRLAVASDATRSVVIVASNIRRARHTPPTSGSESTGSVGCRSWCRRRRARLPAPAVVVLAGDRLAVASDAARPVVGNGAILTGLVAAPRRRRRVARGSRRRRRRGARRRAGRRSGVRVTGGGLYGSPWISARCEDFVHVVTVRCWDNAQRQPGVRRPSSARTSIRRAVAHDVVPCTTNTASYPSGDGRDDPAVADDAAVLGLRPKGRTGRRQPTRATVRAIARFIRRTAYQQQR